MKRIAKLVALFPLLGWSSPGRRPPISVEVTFSKDEKTVALKYGGAERVFVRPLVSPRTYEPAGKVLWVAGDGDDAADGTERKPLKSIQKGVDSAGPGDIVYVRAGTYVESLLLRTSGQEGKPVILSCAPGDLGKVKVTPPKEYVQKNPGGAVVTVQGAEHVWINGLVVEGPRGRPEAPASEKFGANGITWSGKAGRGCRVTNCVIHSNVHCGLKEMGHGGTHILIEANVVFENGTQPTDHGLYCPGDDLTVRGNLFFDHPGFGIHSYMAPKRQTIARNVCLSNKEGGIILGGSHNRVYHNVCASNGVGIFYYAEGCTDNDVRNNISAFNKWDCGFDNGGGKYGSPARNTDDWNCYHPGKPAPEIRPGTHEVLADPLFADPQKGDYRLRPGSPCLGKGADLGAEYKDLGLNLGALGNAGR